MSKYLTARTKLGENLFYDVEDMIAMDLNRFEGWRCEAGLESLYIDYDGSVWVANCAGSQANPNHRHPDLKKKFGYVGSIIDNTFNWPADAVVCPFKHCGCGADIPVTKQAVKSETKIISVRRTHAWPKFVQWDLGRWCNYSCSYCWPDVHNKSDPHKPLDLMVRAVDSIHNNWANGHRIQWSFGGGEPTINPEFIQLVQYLHEKGDYISLVTNGSRNEGYYRQLAKVVDSVQFSLHFEFWKKDVFEKNVKSLVEEFKMRGHGWLEIKIMSKPNHVEESVELQRYFNSMIKEISGPDRLIGRATCVPLRSISDGSKMISYSEKELQIFTS